MKKILIFALLILTFFDSTSQNRSSEPIEFEEDVLSIKPKQERIEVEKEYIVVYKDSTNGLTHEDIRSINFHEFISFPNYKDEFKKKTNYWLRFQIRNISYKVTTQVSKAEF